MPDESDEGDPADGSEEPRERPDADDPERGSPVDPSDLETHDDAAADDGERSVDPDDGTDRNGDGTDGIADTDGADSPADDDDADGIDEGREREEGDEEADGPDGEVADDTTGDADETPDDAGDPVADDGTEDDDVGASAVDDGDDDGADGDDGTGDTDGDSGETDDDDGVDGGVAALDDWPSVKPDPVDLVSSDEGRESVEGDGSDPAAGGDDSEDDAGERETDADDASEEESAEDGQEPDGAASESESDGDSDGADAEPAGDEAGDEGADLPEAQTDGEGYAHDPAIQESGHGGDDLGGISTPPDDQEMPLADHIEEMILRLAAVLLVGAVATVIGLLGASPAIDYIWQNVLPADLDAPPHVYHPLELWLTRIKVAALLGILVALPMFVYQCYLFMRPGLYPNERKYYLSAVPMSLVLAVVGMFISFVLVLPILFRYFTFYSEGSAGIAYALGETFNLIITLTGFLAIVFQIPLFIMLAIMMGVTTRQWLVDKRLYFWAAFFGLSFMFTMDPTLMAPIIVGIIMIVLFEGTLLLLKWTGQE